MRPDFIHIATEGPIGLMTQALLPEDGAGRSPPAITPAFPNMSRPACPCRRTGATRCNGGSITARPAPSSPRRRVAADLEARGFERLMLWSRGVDTELFRPRNVRLFGDRPGVSLCRPHRGGEEHQGLSRSRPSRPQGAGRRRTAGATSLRGFIPMRCSPGRSEGEALARSLCLRRRVRVPEPDRHVRPGAARGAGLRRAGGGLSGVRARKTC